MLNSKEIVNIQGLLVLTVGYVDMTTFPLTKYYYIIERVKSIFFIGCLYVYQNIVILAVFIYSIMEV